MAFGDERRIIWFTGDTSEFDKINQEITLGRITGDLDPVAAVKGVLSIGHLPGIRREQRDAKSAWIEILTDLRDEWPAPVNALAKEPGATNDRSTYRGILLSDSPETAESSAPVPTAAELAFWHQDEQLWVTRVAVSADGRQVATADSAVTARLWQWESGAELHRLHHASKDGAETKDVAFSFDGSLLATASADGTARRWDGVSGKEVHRLTHPDTVTRITFSPDGQTVATVCDDGMVRLWNAPTGEQLQQLGIDCGGLGNVLTGEQIQQLGIDLFSEIMALVFDATGAGLVIADYGDVVLWDLAAERQVGELSLTEGTDGFITDLTMSPTGSLLAIADSRGVAALWDCRTGEPVQEIRHDDAINALCFGPNGSWIATASRDETVRLWDCRTGIELLSIVHDSEVDGVAVSPDGSVLATGCMTGVRAWRLNT